MSEEQSKTEEAQAVLTEEQIALIKKQESDIIDLVHHCRKKERDDAGFGYKFLKYLKTNQLPDSIYDIIKHYLDNPNDEVVIKLMPNEKKG